MVVKMVESSVIRELLESKLFSKDIEVIERRFELREENDQKLISDKKTGFEWTKDFKPNLNYEDAIRCAEEIGFQLPSLYHIVSLLRPSDKVTSKYHTDFNLLLEEQLEIIGFDSLPNEFWLDRTYFERKENKQFGYVLRKKERYGLRENYKLDTALISTKNSTIFVRETDLVSNCYERFKTRFVDKIDY